MPLTLDEQFLLAYRDAMDRVIRQHFNPPILSPWIEDELYFSKPAQAASFTVTVPHYHAKSSYGFTKLNCLKEAEAVEALSTQYDLHERQVKQLKDFYEVRRGNLKCWIEVTYEKQKKEVPDEPSGSRG